MFIEIFPDYSIDLITKYQDEKYIYVKLIDLEKHKKNFFAIEIKNHHSSSNSILYFFYDNKIIAKHKINNFKILHIKSYLNEENDIMVSYLTLNKINTGDVNMHYYFYKLNKGKLENVFEIGYPFYRRKNNRTLFYKPIIKSYNPLIFYNSQEYNILINNYSDTYNTFFKDSLEIKYKWSKENQTYQLISNHAILASFNNNFSKNLTCEDFHIIYKNLNQIKIILNGNDEDLKKNLLIYLKSVLEKYIPDY